MFFCLVGFKSKEGKEIQIAIKALETASELYTRMRGKSN